MQLHAHGHMDIIGKATIPIELNEWKAFGMTLFPLQVALLAIVQNNLMTAW